MACAGDASEILRIVMLGKTGTGKSTLGNTLLGKNSPEDTTSGDQTDCFKVGRGLMSETVKCQWDKAVRFGTTIEVTDTPGLCDTYLREELIYRELAKSVAVAEPGPNIILFVIRCDLRFTPADYQCFEKVKQLFSSEINDYLIVVFNGLASLSKHPRPIGELRKLLHDDVRAYGWPLKDVLENAQNRYFGMDNSACETERTSQTMELINFMKDLVRRNSHSYFKTEAIRQITERVEELVRQEAAVNGLPHTQATANVKRNIVEERVNPGFWSVTEVIKMAAKAVGSSIGEMCSVM